MIKERILYFKRYFETGYNITKYFLYLIGIFGLTTNDLETTKIFIIIYTALSLFIGWAYYKYNWFTIDTEISNKFNPFVHQARKKLGILNTKRFK